MDITAVFMSAAINAFEANKRLADRAVEQVPDAKLHPALDANTNSIAVIMKHVAGNLASRWTDFLTTDGEKPDRNRDSEFVDAPATRPELLAMWEDGWARLFGALQGLIDADLGHNWSGGAIMGSTFGAGPASFLRSWAWPCWWRNGHA